MVTFKDDQDQTTGVVQYTYDMYGKRIRRQADLVYDTVFEQDEKFVYDGNNLALVYENGSLTNRYLYADAIDSALAEDDINSGGYAVGTDWLLGDHQGTIRDVVDALGAEKTHLNYDAFGNVLEVTGTDTTAPRFTYVGQEFDAATGQYYYWHRWYDATTGRWTSVDPIGYAAGDVNLYRYVNNSPVIYIDPTGLTKAKGNQGVINTLSSLILGSIGGGAAGAAAAYTNLSSSSTWTTGSGWGGSSTSLQSLLGSSANALKQFSSGPSPTQWVNSTPRLDIGLPNIDMSGVSPEAVAAQVAKEGAATPSFGPTPSIWESLWDDVKHTGNVLAENAPGYLQKSASQVFYGDYTNDVTALGTAIQVGAGFVGLDAPADIRDISASLHNWEWSWSHAGSTALNVAGLLPVVGSLKSADEVAALAKQGGTVVKGTGAYRDVAGHHVHAKKAFDGALGYDFKEAFSVSADVLQQHGVRHADITTAQQRLFREFAASGAPNTLAHHSRIAYQAMVEAGMPPSVTKDLVIQSQSQLIRGGIVEPTKIPWGGR